jgi:hypothetical protein
MTLSITMLYHSAECGYTERGILFIVMVIIIMVSAIMVSVIMVSVIMVSVIMVSVIMLNVIMLSVILLNVVVPIFLIEQLSLPRSVCLQKKSVCVLTTRP